VQTVADFAEQYDLDGINFEYVFQFLSVDEHMLSDHLPVGNIPTNKA
jgi:uncharacterized lipoprotein YddW (UPF0748 family)